MGVGSACGSWVWVVVVGKCRGWKKSIKRKKKEQKVVKFTKRRSTSTRQSSSRLNEKHLCSCFCQVWSVSIKAGRGMRNAYYQLISRPSEICILRLAEIYNSSGQQRLLLARRNAITVGKGSGRSEKDPLTYWKHNLQINAKSLSLKINRWPPPTLKKQTRKKQSGRSHSPRFCLRWGGGFTKA